MNGRWVCADPAWVVLLQRDAVRVAGPALTSCLEPDVLTYRHTGIEVQGRDDLVPVTIEFHRDPPYHCFELAAEDYPRVLADPGARSPHRMPEDDRLCLWKPNDPDAQRWTAEDGLQRLFDITADHLFAEQHWRFTLRRDEHGVEVGEWPISEAAHGGVTLGRVFPASCTPTRPTSAPTRRMRRNTAATRRR